MSVTLSMISRQLEPSIKQGCSTSSRSSRRWPTSGISGRRTCRGGLPSTSCQTNSRPPRTRWARTGAGAASGALGVGDRFALAVAPQRQSWNGQAISSPLMVPLRQVAAHVPAVAVEDLEITLRVGEHHQLGAERVDRVRLAVPVLLTGPQAVPSACVKRSGNAPGLYRERRCGQFPWSLRASRSVLLTRTRYSFAARGAMQPSSCEEL